VTDRQTDRLTDHATRSVRLGRIYVRSTAMRPKNVTSESTKNIAKYVLYQVANQTAVIFKQEKKLHFSVFRILIWSKCIK